MKIYSVSEPKKKKELKVYSFTRIINFNDNTNEIPEKNSSKFGENRLNLELTLYDKEISLVAQRESINPKLPKIVYEQYINLEILQSMNKFFYYLDTEKIFTIIHNGFKQKLDQILIEEDKIVIKLMINNREMMNEEIIFELQMIKLSTEEEITIIKESLKLLTNEKKDLKNEVILLKNAIEELKRISYEKDIEMEKKLEENKNEFEKIMEQKEKEFQNMLKQFQKEMSEVKEIDNDVKEKIIINEKKEQNIKSNTVQRKKTVNKDIFDMDITFLLFEKKIKINIKEIQNNLKNNPIFYETDYEMKHFGKLSNYYKNKGGIKAIFDFLVLRFNENKDIIIKVRNKIIFKIKYTFESEEDEIILEICKKEVGLKNTLTNIEESLRELNKEIIDSKEKINIDLIETKEELKINLLDKVYPIGSYYWSEKDYSPDNLFGGRWNKIEGRFLFASDSNHLVGETGGEEKHQLTIDEIPSHNHYYNELKEDYYFCGSGDELCPVDKRHKFTKLSKTGSCGGSKHHNNMPPFLTANCWKRIS